MRHVNCSHKNIILDTKLNLGANTRVFNVISSAEENKVLKYLVYNVRLPKQCIK